MKRVLLVIDAQTGSFNRVDRSVRDDFSSRLYSLLRLPFDLKCATFFGTSRGSLFHSVLGMEVGSEPSLVYTKEFDYILSKDGYSLLDTYGAKYIKSLFKDCVVYICGADTDASVLSTAYSLFSAGIPVKVLEGYCFTMAGVDVHDYALKLLSRNIGANNIIFGVVKSIDAI